MSTEKNPRILFIKQKKMIKLNQFQSIKIKSKFSLNFSIQLVSIQFGGSLNSKVTLNSGSFNPLNSFVRQYVYCCEIITFENKVCRGQVDKSELVKN